MRPVMKGILCLTLVASFSSYADDFKFRTCFLEKNSKVRGSIEIRFSKEGSFTAGVKLNEGAIREVFLPCTYKVETIKNTSKVIAMDCRSDDSNIVVQVPSVQGAELVEFIRVFKDSQEFGACQVKN